jgi:DNA-binding response OmpR family regulator
VIKMDEKKILIVDDDKDFLGELKELLTRSGYAVIDVFNSSEALKVARAEKPDVILLDLRMRQTSGFEIADGLKRFAETMQIPVIAMTGFYTMKEHSWLMNFCGIQKCLKKPFNPLDVIAEIEYAINKTA